MPATNFNILTGLTVGNVTANASANSLATSGNITAGNLASTGLTSTVTLTVSGTSNLGAIGNVIITGGSANQVIVTNGNGTLNFSNISSLIGGVQTASVNQVAYYTGTDTVGGSANLTWNGANTLTVTGAVNATNVSASTLSVVGNANVGNIGATNANLSAATITGNLDTGNTSASLFTGNISGTSGVFSGNVTFGNINAVSGILGVTGNITGGNLITTGWLNVSGNANVGNIGAAAGVFTTLSSTGNTFLATSSGNVGIGTIVPVTKLDVNGKLSIGNTADTADQGEILKIRVGSTGSTVGYINFSRASDTNWSPRFGFLTSWGFGLQTDKDSGPAFIMQSTSSANAEKTFLFGATNGSVPGLLLISNSGVNGGSNGSERTALILNHPGTLAGSNSAIKFSSSDAIGTGLDYAKISGIKETSPAPGGNPTGGLGFYVTANSSTFTQAVTIKSSGNFLIGTDTDGNFKLDVAKSGSAGTARFYDATATTGVTTVVIRAGAGQSTTNLMEWQNSSGTKLASITSNGSFAMAGLYSGGVSPFGIGWQNGNGSYYSTLKYDNTRSSWYNENNHPLGLPSSGLALAFYSGTSGSSAFDVGLSRNAAGVVEINNGTAGTYRDLIVRDIFKSGTTVKAVWGGENLTTAGSVPYVSASGVLNQDAAVLTWDSSIGRLTVTSKSNTNTVPLIVAAPSGTTAEIVLSSNGGTATGRVGLDAGANLVFRQETGGSLYLDYYNQVIWRSVANSYDVRLKLESNGNFLIGTNTDGNFRLDVAKSGSAGTARFYDQTATTGVTKVVVQAGANQTTTNLTEWQLNNGTILMSVAPTLVSLANTVRLDVVGSITASTWWRLTPGGSGNTGFEFGATNRLTWSDTAANYGATKDTGLARNSAGVLEINNGTAGTYRDLQLRSINPTSGNVGIGNTTPTHTLRVEGTFSASGNANVGNLEATAGVFTGNVSAGNLTVSGTSSITGNFSAGNLISGNLTLGSDALTSSHHTITIDPSTAGVGGNVIIQGNLQVTGTTTTVNSTTVEVTDLNLTLAKDAINAAAANGAGLTVAGANANITYASTGDKWTFNKPVDVTGAIIASTTVTATGNVVGGNVTTTGTVKGTKLVGGEFSTNGANLDLGIYANDFKVLEVYGSVNPNNGGSSSYTDIVHCYVYHGVGWNGSAVTSYIYVQHISPPARSQYGSGTGLTHNLIDAVWLSSGNVESDSCSANSATHQVRLKCTYSGSLSYFTVSVLKRM